MSEPPSSVRTVFGWLLVLLGALWVLFTGGCTLMFVGPGVADLMRDPAASSGGLAFFLVIGLVCVSPGVAALWVGIDMVRRPRTPPAA